MENSPPDIGFGQYLHDLDILPQLYGPRLWLPGMLAPEAETTTPPVPVTVARPAGASLPKPTEPSTTPRAQVQLAGKPRVEWKLKQGVRLTLLLQEHEYADKTLTELLKKIIQALEIPFGLVAFGKVLQPVTETDLHQLPTRLGIAFGQELLHQVPLTNSAWLHPPTELYVVHSLTALQADVALKRSAWNTMQRFRDRILTD